MKVSDVPQLLRKTVVHLIIICVLGLIVYSNTVKVPFMFDDVSQIMGNSVIKSLEPLTPVPNRTEYNLRRSVGYFSFALNYRIGKLNVTGYHIVNLAIHLINGMLVYFLLLLTFQTPFFRSRLSAISYHKKPVFRGLRGQIEELSSKDPTTQQLNCSSSRLMSHDSRFFALIVALLFVTHPVQTMAVTYIVQRFTSLATMFYLFSVVTYIKGRLKQEEAEDKVKKYSASVLTCFFLTFLSAVLAMKTKENAFTLPVMVLLYEFTFFKSSMRRGLLLLVLATLTVVIVAFNMIDLSKPVGEIFSALDKLTRAQSMLPRWDYLMTQFRVIVTYIRLLILPVNQNVDYYYPIYHSFFALPVFLSFLFLSALLATAVYLLYKSQKAIIGQQSKEEGRQNAAGSLSH